MKKTVMAMAGLLGLLILVALAGRVEGTTDSTYVDNSSSRWIRATITYNFPFATPGFTDRLLSPGTYQSDQYSDADCNIGSNYPNTVNVLIWIDGSSNSNTAVVSCDNSVVIFDNPTTSGDIDVYQSVYGSIGQAQNPLLFTLSP